MKFNEFTAQATTSCTGSQLSMQEMTLGIDRYDMPSDRGHGRDKSVTVEVTDFVYATLSDIITNDKYIKFDLLARNVIEHEGYSYHTEVQIGRNGRVQELITPDEKRFRQIRQTYYGDVS